MKIEFPYGRSQLELNIPEDIPYSRYLGCLRSKLDEYTPAEQPEDLVSNALENPIASPKLRELAKGKQRVVILCSDHTRPVPTKIIAPLLLKEIRKGNASADITFLVATGCHRKTTDRELNEKFGEEIYKSEKIVVHDCDDQDQLVNLGKLPSGGDLELNRLAVEADLLVAEGFIEPHFFAGFSGGRKSVLPGIASRKTVMYNHNSGFIADRHSRTGITENNRIHQDMVFAARAVNLKFICNVIMNSHKRILKAVAGDVEAAHLQGQDFLRENCTIHKLPADIVITGNGGYPLDQNIYQAVKGLTAAESTVKPGGVIIMLAEAIDGHGGEGFYRTFQKEKDLTKLMRDILDNPPENTIEDQWQSQILVRVLQHAHVIFVSKADDQVVKDLHMIPAHSIREAIALADSFLDAEGIHSGKVLAIPDGVSVIVQ